MEGEFRLHHGSATTEKAAQAAGRVEAIVGDVVNGNRRAWGRIDVEDIALLIQHARDAAASPDWLSKMAIDTLVTRGDAIKAQRDAATARAEAAEQRAEGLEREVAQLRADCAILGGELSEANRLLLSGIPQQRGAAAERAAIAHTLKARAEVLRDRKALGAAEEVEALAFYVEQRGVAASEQD